MSEAPAPNELDEIQEKMMRLDSLKDELINRLYHKIERLESRESQLEEAIKYIEERNRDLEKKLEEGVEEYPGEIDILRRDVKAMQLYIEECNDAGKLIHPDDVAPDNWSKNDPPNAIENFWANRGWSWDSIGFGWCPPGYHIVRPGKIQRNDY